MASLKTLLCSIALLLSLSMSINICQARDFVVGGDKMSWRIPSDPDEFNKWASMNRFLIGDSLVIKYDPNIDSVLQVSENNYRTCNKSNPIKSYSDGNTRIALDRSGPFYFISGAQNHCEKGQKLEVVVLSPRPSGDNESRAPSPSGTSDHEHQAQAPSPDQAHEPEPEQDHDHLAPAPSSQHDHHHHHYAPAPSPNNSGAFVRTMGTFSSSLGLLLFMALV